MQDTSPQVAFGTLFFVTLTVLTWPLDTARYGASLFKAMIASEARFFKAEVRSRRNTTDSWHDAAFWFGVIYDALSDFGSSMMRPLYVWLLSVPIFAAIYFWDAKVPKSQWLESCTGGNSSKMLRALTLSATNALPVIGSNRAEAAQEFYRCISLTHATTWNTVIQITQTLCSAILIFLFLLAVRNQFKIK